MMIRSQHCRRGVTLLEAVLAIGLLVVLSSMTYWFYFSSLETTREGTAEAQRTRLARYVLKRLADEIRQATVMTTDDRVGIRGEAERIWLSTMRLPSREMSKRRLSFAEPPSAEFDMVKIEYKIVRHPDIMHEDGYERPLGLARIELRIPRPDSAESGEAREEEGDIVQPEEGEDALEDAFFDEFYEDATDGTGVESEIEWNELYSQEILFLRFCYFDGSKWWDEWNVSGESPLPQAVQITIGFEPHPPMDDEEFQLPKEMEEFCTCMNERNNDDVMDECVELPADQMTAVVRVPQGDPLFRSRVSREAQAMVEELGGELLGETP